MKRSIDRIMPFVAVVIIISFTVGWIIAILQFWPFERIRGDHDMAAGIWLVSTLIMAAIPLSILYVAMRELPNSWKIITGQQHHQLSTKDRFLYLVMMLAGLTLVINAVSNSL